MHYKTIILELLKQHPKIYHHLHSQRTLLPTLERLARKLKTHHQRWQDRLCQVRLGSHPYQIASEALEIALWELECCLRSEFPSDDNK